jgi:hypothetical protein
MKHFIKGFEKAASIKSKLLKGTLIASVPVGGAAYGIDKLTQDPDEAYYKAVREAKKVQSGGP